MAYVFVPGNKNPLVVEKRRRSITRVEKKEMSSSFAMEERERERDGEKLGFFAYYNNAKGCEKTKRTMTTRKGRKWKCIQDTKENCRIVIPCFIHDFRSRLPRMQKTCTHIYTENFHRLITSIMRPVFTLLHPALPQ